MASTGIVTGSLLGNAGESSPPPTRPNIVFAFFGIVASEILGAVPLGYWLLDFGAGVCTHTSGARGSVRWFPRSSALSLRI
jgi:hypothetical protein